MKKILFIANMDLRKSAKPNGVNVKNRHILKYLENIDKIKEKTIDTANWKRNLLKLFFGILINSITHDKVILSINTKSAYYIIKFLNIFKLESKIIYIVVGGGFPQQIVEGKLNLKYYRDIYKIYVQTSTMEKKLTETGLNNVEELPNSKYFKEITLDINKKITNPIQCYYLGRIHPDKGIEMIFESFKEINIDYTKFQIDFYGPIDEEFKTTFMNEIDNCNNFSYKGSIDLMKNSENYYLLSKYDLFIFPTYWEGEGFPGVIIDSFISGVPALVSDWNYNIDVIEEDYNGFVFESKNLISLIEKLQYIYNNPNMLKDMSENAHASASNYKTENVLKKLEGLL